MPNKPDQSLESVRARLDSLDAKLEGKTGDARTANPQLKSENASWGMAVRVSADFISAIFVGGLLGWGLDQIAGTEPFGLIILLLLGFAAGVLNVMRTTGVVAQLNHGKVRQDDAGPEAKNHG